MMDVADCALFHLSGSSPCQESVDYVNHRSQFHLQNLTTEQHHPRTSALSELSQSRIDEALNSLTAVDRDITTMLDGLDASAYATLNQLANEMLTVVLHGGRVIYYGCGATGRLSVSMESALWRPFVARNPGLDQHLAGIANQCVGLITGGDRAVISSLEGFEDIQEMGAAQLQEVRATVNDLVICVTEGGETSSVIGCINEAFRLHVAHGSSVEEAAKRLYFVFNNPPSALMFLDRCLSVLRNPSISQINLCTGPQAITGSTRMQAASSELWVLGYIQQSVLERLVALFSNCPAPRSLSHIPPLRSFEFCRQASVSAMPASLATWVEWESSVYRASHHACYIAHEALLTVLTDVTERSPTFRLAPLDRALNSAADRRCWLSIHSFDESLESAWTTLLKRPFRGLLESWYGKALRAVDDPRLQISAARSLKHAGAEQQLDYNFALASCRPATGDLVVVVVMNEEILILLDSHSRVSMLLRNHLHSQEADNSGSTNTTINGASVTSSTSNPSRAIVIHLCSTSLLPEARHTTTEQLHAVLAPARRDNLLYIHVMSGSKNIEAHTTLKLTLNAVSTCIMARLGRVYGNSMLFVSPSNLKLVGRATYLLQHCYNDFATRHSMPTITYALANAVLYDTIHILVSNNSNSQGSTGVTSSSGVATTPPSSEVVVSLVRIAQCIRAHLQRTKTVWNVANVLELLEFHHHDVTLCLQECVTI